MVSERKLQYTKMKLEEKLILLCPDKMDALLFTIMTSIKQIIYKKRVNGKAPTVTHPTHFKITYGNRGINSNV